MMLPSPVLRSGPRALPGSLYRSMGGSVLTSAEGQKRKKRVAMLVAARESFVGVGTRKVKVFLNKAGKIDVYALALRMALEAEDANITAKRYFGGDCGGYSYADIHYSKKAEKIEALIEISKAQGWTFGIQPSDIPATAHVIYF